MPEVNQADDHRAGFIVEVAGFHREGMRPEVDADGIEPGHARPQRDKGIHGGGAVQQAFPGAAVKMPAREHHHGESDRANHQPQGAVGIGDHHIVTQHAPQHHRNTDQQRDNGLPAETF